MCNLTLELLLQTGPNDVISVTFPLVLAFQISFLILGRALLLEQQELKLELYFLVDTTVIHHL